MRFSGRPPLTRNFSILLAVTAVALGAVGLVLSSAFPEWRWVHYPVHAAVESVGAFAALIVALLILGLRTHGQLGHAYTWIASGLVGMGVLDGLHALHHEGESFVWLHSLATFVGGLVFVGVWFPERLSQYRVVRILPKIMLGVVVALAIGSMVFPTTIPIMVVDSEFTLWARMMNIIGGIGFLAAALFFALGMQRDGENGEGHAKSLLFAWHCLLFGLSSVIFEFSAVWDAAWWFWHVLRFGAYMIAVLFYFNLTRSFEYDLFQLKQNLEQTVEERTASLKEAQTTLRKIGMAIDQSPILVFITDAMGIIEYVNPKFEEVTGYSRAEAIGQTPRIIKSDDTPPEVHEDMWRTILSGKVWSGEVKDTVKDGRTLWASAIISPIRNEQGTITHFVAMHEDITARKLAQEAMSQARQAAEVANKAKTDFMANMSHELRTPLNAIIGFSEAITQGVFGPVGNQKYQEYGEHILSSGRHLLELINDILDVSAVEAGQLKIHEDVVDLVEICDTAIRLVQTRADAGGVTLEGLTNADLPGLKGDPLRIKQIFLNLLSNAVKFTPEGGRVTCGASLNSSGDMIVTVTDTGIGMDAEGMKKALSPFGQVDSSLSRKHEGTGLGLPLTKGLVELHGGTLQLDSALGKGTTVIVTFPAERVVAAEQPMPAEQP